MYFMILNLILFQLRFRVKVNWESTFQVDATMGSKLGYKCWCRLK